MEEKTGEVLGSQIDQLGDNHDRVIRSISDGNCPECVQISLYANAGYTHGTGVNPKPPMAFEKHLQFMNEIDREDILRLAVNGERVRLISSAEDLRTDESLQLGKSYTEDRHVIFIGTTADNAHVHGLGIFDGHGGSTEFAELGARIYYSELLTNPFSSQDDISQYLELSIEKMHRNAEAKLGSKHGGSTAILAAILGNKVILANLGDSLAMLFRRTGGETVAVKKTTDHDIHNPSEMLRLKPLLESGEVQLEGHYMKIRNSTLMVTAAIGDWGFHKALRRKPEHYEWDLEDEDILVLASDGIAEVKDVEGGFFRGCMEKRLPNIINVIDKNLDFNRLSKEIADGQITQMAEIHGEYIGRLEATNPSSYRAVIRRNQANPKTIFCEVCTNSTTFCKECYLKEYGNNFRANRDNQDIICYKHESPKQKSGNPRSFSY